ncbi:MAG: hypothetical protein ACOYJE_03055 [Bacteroidaceae bacterium]|jgi:hypothetical protein
MGLKIVISSSRSAKEKQIVIDELKLRDNALATLGNVAKRIDYIYDCDTESTVFGTLPKQDEINKYIIPGCDWFILLAPLRHVGDKTAGEALAAYDAVMKEKGLVFSLFYCKNPFNVPDDEYEKELVKNDCVKRPSDVSLDKLLQTIQDVYKQDSKHYMKDYQYTEDCSSLAYRISEEFDILVQENRFLAFRVDGLAIMGRDVDAKQLYYDKNRALEFNGFYEKLYYPRQGVDEQLGRMINGGCRIIAVTGMPGAGKTRLVFEYVRRNLAHERVVLMDRNNVRDVVERLKLEVKVKARRLGISEREYVQEKRLYFVADQVRDLFESAAISAECIEAFYKSMLAHRNYVFICTMISNAYNSFVMAYPAVKNLLGSNANLCGKLEIQPIGKSQDDANFVNWLRLHYEKTNGGKTVADYIPRLNNYVEHIIRQLTGVKDETLGSYIKCFLKACQLISVFRYSSPLCLVVMLMRQRYKEVMQEDFADNVTKCIDYLGRNNAVWMSRGINGKMFDYDNEQTYDGESMKTIVPPDITFSVNELVWKALLERDAALKVEEQLFYRWNDPDETVNAISWFFATFPTAKTLSRVVARIPKTDNYMACMQRCVEVIKQKIPQFKETEKEEITFVYNLLIGRAANRRNVRRLVEEMYSLGLQPNESTIGEMIRFSQSGRETYAQEDIEIFQKKNNIADNVYSVSRKLEYFIGNFTEAMAYLRQDNVEQVFARVRTVGSLFTIDYLSLKRIYGILATLCTTTDDINALVQYANARYEAALQLIEAENNCDDIIDVIDLHVRCMYEVDDELLDNIYDIATAKAMLKEYVDRLFLLNYSVVYSLIEKVFHNKPLQELLQTYLEEGKGVWAGIKANNREIVYVGLIRVSEDFDTSYTYYNAWKEKAGHHNPQMFAMCLENCHRHEYKAAVQAFRKLEEEIGGADKVSLILYNQMLKISPSLDDAMVFMKSLKSVDDYTLSNLLGIIDNIKDENPKRFAFAYELINMPLFAGLRCNIHAMALMYKLAESRKHERYLYHLIDRDLQENEAIGLKKLIAASKQINSILIRKRYRSLDVAFRLLEIYKKRYMVTAANGEKMAPDCYSALCGKITSCMDSVVKNEAFKRWDALIEADKDMLEIDEFFYSTLYRYRKLNALINDKGEVSAEFRRDIESVKVTKSRIFEKIMSTMYSEGFGFESIWNMYVYYRDTFVTRKMEKGLYPYITMYKILRKAAAGNTEWQKLVDKEQASFGFDRLYARSDNSIFIYKKLENVKNYHTVLQILKDEINSGYLLPCVLNASMDKIYCMRGVYARQHEVCYAAVQDFLRDNPVVFDSFTMLTYLSLLKLAPTFEEKLKWLFKQGEEPACEVFLGTVATDFIIGRYNIDITRRYFDLWLNIYKDLGLTNEKNFQTMGRYLRIEIEYAHEGYLERARNVLRLFAKHKYPVSVHTFKKRSWTELSEKLLVAFPDCAAIVDKIVISK